MSRNRAATRRGKIGLGDLATALATLDIASEMHLRTLARCLGLGGLSFAPVGTRKAATDPRLRHRRPQPKPQEPSSPGFLPPLPPAPPPAPAEYLDTSPEPLPPAQPSDAPPPDWNAPPQMAAKAPAPAREPLFPRRTAPGVLGAAVATLRQGRRPDIERLIAHITSGRPFRELPRLPLPSLSRGVQLLLDRGESMTPFFADQVDLVRSFMRLAGTPRCEVFEFLDDPAAASSYTETERLKTWRPQSGRPVVVVTDFGLGDSLGSAPRVARDLWRRFAADLTRRRCLLVAVVPHGPAEWPTWIERHFATLHWDPRTRAENVRALVGPGHQVEP